MNAAGTSSLTRILPFAVTLATIPAFTGINLSLISEVLILPNVFEQRFVTPGDSLTNSLGGRSHDAFKIQIILEFANRLISDQKEIPPVFKQYIEDHFWDLLC